MLRASFRLVCSLQHHKPVPLRRYASSIAFVDTNALVALSNPKNSLHQITKAALQGYQLWYTPTVRREFGKDTPAGAQRFPPRTNTDIDGIEDDDDLLFTKIPIPASAKELEAALTVQCLTREKKPLPIITLANRRVLSVAIMEEAFKEIWDVRDKDLNLVQKDGFRHDLFMVFEASYHMYDLETGWNLGSPSPVFVTNNLKFYKRFIADPTAKGQLRHVIGKYGFEHLIEVKTVGEVVSAQVEASGA